MQWFTVIGLVLDIAAVSLLAWEWYVANHAPARVIRWYRSLLVGGREISLKVT